MTAQWQHRAAEVPPSAHLYCCCRRTPLQHTSTLNYLLPLLSHFKDRCTNSKPEHKLFISLSLFNPQGFSTGCVVSTRGALQAFFKKLVTLQNQRSAADYSSTALFPHWCVMQDKRHRSCIGMTSNHTTLSYRCGLLVFFTVFYLMAQEERESFLQWPTAGSELCRCI